MDKKVTFCLYNIFFIYDMVWYTYGYLKYCRLKIRVDLAKGKRVPIPIYKIELSFKAL